MVMFGGSQIMKHRPGTAESGSQIINAHKRLSSDSS